MATARNAAPTPNIAPMIMAGAVVAGIAAALFRLPGALIMLIGFVAAGWLSTPPQLTGKKDAYGYPTVGNPGEGRKLDQHRFFQALKWKLLIPSADWAPNDVRATQQIAQQAGGVWWRVLLGWASWFLVPKAFITWVAIAAAAAVFTLPVDQLTMLGGAWGIDGLTGTAAWLMWPNAAAAYILTMQVDAIRRQMAAPKDPQPVVDIPRLLDALNRKGQPAFVAAVAGAVAAVAGFTVTGVAINGFELAWLIHPWPVTAAGAGVACAALTLRAMALPHGLEQWRNTVERRAFWEQQFETLKIDPAPYLTSHRRLDRPAAQEGENPPPPVMVDTFEAPATLGAKGFRALFEKSAANIFGETGRGVFLHENSLDPDGQPMTGTKSPVRFSIVAWPTGADIDLTDPQMPEQDAHVLIRTVISAGVFATGWEQPAFVGIEKISADDSPAAWKAFYAEAGETTMESLIGGAAAGAEGFAGGTFEVMPELDEHAFYLGHLSGDRTQFIDPAMPQRIIELERERMWDDVWPQLNLKGGEQPPTPQHAVYSEFTLSSGQTLIIQPFLNRRGVLSEWFMTQMREQTIANALGRAPFCSIQRWDGGGRVGERDNTAMRIIYSHQPIPHSPAKLAPMRGGRDASKAMEFVLQSMLNRGFDAAKLDRPEITGVTPLTSQQSPRHIWEMKVRLYGAATLAGVKAASEKIRNGMGAVEWIRFSEGADGITITAGASPREKGLVWDRRARGEAKCIALDWEQAFIDAKLLSPVDARGPQLVSAGRLESNDQVEDLVFALPRGLAITDFQEPKALDRMRTNAEKTFIDVRAIPDDPTRFRMLACDIDPMPNPAPFMWDVLGPDQPRAVSFGTNVEGAPVTWRLDLDSHLLVLGSNGSGKGIAMTSMVTSALMAGWEVFAADPIKGFNDFAFADPWLKLRATTYPDTVAVVRRMIELLEERKQLNASYGVANIKDLPDEVRPPITAVFIDEFTSLVIPEVLPKLPDRASEDDVREHQASQEINAAKATIGTAIGRILREGRATGLVMVLAGQKLTANETKYVPGGSTIKSQMSRLAMGKMSYGDMASAFNDAPSAMGLLGTSVPRGRGIFESTAQAAFAVQTWWGGGSQPEHFAAMTDRIAEFRDPLTEDEKFDPERLRPASDTDAPIFGRRIDADGDGIPDEDEIVDVAWEGEEIDLGVVDLGLEGLFGGAEEAAHEEHEPGLAPLGLPRSLPLPFGGEAPGDAAGLVPVSIEPDVFEQKALHPLDPASIAVFVGPGVSDEEDVPPGAIDVDELAPTHQITGHPLVDALLSWVIDHPGTARVDWMSPAAFDTDESGTPLHVVLAQTGAMFGLMAVRPLEVAAAPAARARPFEAETVQPAAADPTPALLPQFTVPAPLPAPAVAESSEAPATFMPPAPAPEAAFAPPPTAETAEPGAAHAEAEDLFGRPPVTAVDDDLFGDRRPVKLTDDIFS